MRPRSFGFPTGISAVPIGRVPGRSGTTNGFHRIDLCRQWKTPLLVIHGEKDFRVPVTQGMEAFTAAQLNGVPSRFLYFPEEGHWVLEPQNGVLWHRVFFDWLDRYCKPQ